MLGALALVAGWPAIAVPGFGILALVALTGAWAWRRPSVELERAVEPERVAKGSDAVLVVRARNRARRAVGALAVEQRVGPATMGVELPRLRAGQVGVRTYRLPTEVRGELEVGPMEAVRADPWGLWRRVQRLGEATTIVVGPRVLALRALPTGTSRHVEGPTSDTAPQGSTTFHRLREYVVGDDLRTVHWPSTARAGTLVVRHQVDTAQPSTVVLLDLRPEVHSAPGFEEAVDIAASVVVGSGEGGAPVQLRTTAGTQVATQVAASELLTRAAPDPAGSLEAALAALRRERGGTSLVVVTGQPDTASLRAAASLQRRYERVVVACVTERPATVPVVAGLTVVAVPDAARFAVAWATTVAR